MAIKATFAVEVEMNDQRYVFHMPYNRPLQECYDAAQKVCQELVDFSNAMAAKEKKDKEEAQKQEDAVQEVQVEGETVGQNG